MQVSRFSRTPTCDRQKDGHRDTRQRHAYTALAQRCADKTVQFVTISKTDILPICANKACFSYCPAGVPRLSSGLLQLAAVAYGEPALTL